MSIQFIVVVLSALVGAAVSASAAGVLYQRLLRRERCLRSSHADHRQAAEWLAAAGLKIQELTPRQTLELASRLSKIDKRRFQRAALASVLLVTTMGGLAGALVVQHFAALNAPKVSVIYSTDSGGEKQVTLPAANLSLLAALRRAGATPSSARHFPGEPWLVAVRQQPLHGGKILYFPLKWVSRGPPGEIMLEPGDTVSLVPLAETSLGTLDSTEPGIPFEVHGLIEKPGKYRTLEISETLLNVTTSAYAGSFDGGQDGPDVMVVSRPRSGEPPREHYFIPLRNPDLDMILLDSRIAGGDQIDYSRFEELEFPRRRSNIPLGFIRDIAASVAR